MSMLVKVFLKILIPFIFYKETIFEDSERLFMAFSISTVGIVKKSSNEENEEYVNEGMLLGM